MAERGKRDPLHQAATLATLAVSVLLLHSEVAAARAVRGDLSVRLARLAKQEVRSRPPAKQAAALGLSRNGPGTLLRKGTRVLADVQFGRGGAAARPPLREAGAQVLALDRRLATATVAVPPDRLRAISRLAGVEHVGEELEPVLAAQCPSGPVVSEGDSQLRAAQARSDFGLDGSGVTVGVLSDSFDRALRAAGGSGAVATHATQDVESGDLPGPANSCASGAPVGALDDSESEGADEGRAMLQMVHDLAPGAGLAFATAFKGELAFARNVERLAEPPTAGGAGARVIADDVGYFFEPFFQDGPIAVAIERVTESGVTYISAAGNNNLIDAAGHDIASWEAPVFHDAGGCPAGLGSLAGFAEGHCMDFDPGPSAADPSFGLSVEAGATLTVDLQWAEPWFGVRTDLDVVLLDASGNPIEAGGYDVGGFEDNVGGSQRPAEILQWENSGATRLVQLAIARCAQQCNPRANSSTAPRLKLALLENGGGVSATEYPASTGGDIVGPTIFGHAGASGAIAAGAVPYFASTRPESYSSRGPVTHYFAPVYGTTAAPALPSPETVAKPDLAATDCGATSFFAFFVAREAKWRFCGTSAAAPHAAAVVALMLQAAPASTPASLRAALYASGAPVGGYGDCAVGAGLIDAVHAVQALQAGGEGGSAPTCGQPPPEVGQEGDTPLPVQEGGTPTAVQEAEPGAPAPLEPQPLDPSASTGPASAQSPPDARIQTSFARVPPKVVKTTLPRPRVIFLLRASKPAAEFSCKVDRRPWRSCRRRFVRRFPSGRHAVRVRAHDAAGRTDPTPAVYRFRVRRVASR